MSIERCRNRSIAWALGAAVLLASSWAYADPPGRAARLAYADGQVSFSPAGQDDWVQSTVNRPLTTGDRLWADSASRAELQLGGGAIRMGALTNVTLLNVDDNITQVQLLQGALKIRVRYLAGNQSFEVDTPNLAFTVRRAGDYRIEVDPNGNSTTVMVNSGEAEVYGDGAAYAVRANQGYSFYGTGLTDYDTFGTRREDALEQWARDRDRRFDSSVSARYVSGDVVGYEDLDSNGTWRQEGDYGNVWIPNHVAANWTPYHDGHWAWVDPWGWTWVDDAPWGYAVSHYGRWARIHNAWGWVPGPQRERAVYAPALVVFVGGRDFSGSVSIGAGNGNVGWFPLAPREVYQPAYQVSRGYFDHINRSNAVIAPTVITNIYNTHVTNTTNVTNVTNVTNITKVVYVNQSVAGAVVAVPSHAFVQSQPVAKVAVAVAAAAAMSAPTTHFAAVAPVVQSLHGGAGDARARPVLHDRNIVVARTAPPPPPIAFTAQAAQLALKPGAPIDDSHRAQLKPVAPVVAAAKVNVVTATTPAAPSVAPPATPPAHKTSEQRKAQAAQLAGIGAANPPTAASRPAVVGGDTAQLDASKADAARAQAQAQAAKEAASAAGAKNVDAARAEAAKQAAIKAEADKAAAGKADAAKAEAAKAEALRAAEASRMDAAKKADAEKANAAKTEAAKADAAKAEAAKADAARKAEADKTNAARTDTAKADAARAEAAKAEAAKKAEADKANASRAAEAAKVEAAKKAEADRANAANAANAARAAEAAKVAAAKKAEADRANADRANAARAEAAKAEEAKKRAETEKARESKAEEANKAAHAHAPAPKNGDKADEEEKIRAEEAKKR